MSNETYKLSEDLQWLVEVPTMEKGNSPTLSDDNFGEMYIVHLREVEEYHKHLASMKKYKAEGFDKHYLGRELKEKEDFNLVIEDLFTDKEIIIARPVFAQRKYFNEQSLRDEIIKVWGEHGAHLEVYDNLLKNKK
jgi:hypothetical protein